MKVILIILNDSDNISDNDSFSLDNISLAISQKNVTLLQTSIHEIIDSYVDRTDISHIYIKYLSTNILHMLMNNIPNLNENELKIVTDEVYNLKKFSTIFDSIENENNSSNKAILTVCQYKLY